VGSGCPLTTGEGSGRGDASSPENFFDFGSQNGDFGCILGTTFFTVHAGAEGVWVGFLMFGLEIVYYGAL